MYERSEIVTQQRTRAFISSDADHEGLTATLDEVDLCVITYASIEGQSALRIPHAMLTALLDLTTALAAEPAMTGGSEQAEVRQAGLQTLKEKR